MRYLLRRLQYKKHVGLEGDIPSAMHPPFGCPFQIRFGWKAEVPNRLCDIELPTLRKLPGGQQIKCHFSDDIPALMEPVIKIVAG